MGKSIKTNIYPLISFFISFLLVLVLFLLNYRQIRGVGVSWLLLLVVIGMIFYYDMKKHELKTIKEIYMREMVMAAFFLVAFFALYDFVSFFDSDIVVFAPISMMALGGIAIFGDYYHQKELLTGKKEEISKEELIRILIFVIGYTLFMFALFYVMLYW